MLLREYIREVLEEEVHGLTLYHGTDGNNIKSIAQHGLKTGSPMGTAQRGVYLTPTFEKAVRYAHGDLTDTGSKGEVPIVLEVYISGRKRTKKLEYDPLDRPDLWRDQPEDWGDLEEVRTSLEWGITRVAKKLGWKPKSTYDDRFRGADRMLDRANELEDLDGFELTKEVISLMTGFNVPLAQIKKAVKEEFPPDSDWGDGYVTISPSGTIQLTDMYYRSKEQLIFPKTLPPSTIKSVWVRCQDFPKSSFGEEREAGSTELPGEARSRLEGAEAFFGELLWKQEVLKKDDDDLLEDIEKAKGYEVDELVKALRAMLDAMKRGDDLDEFVEAVTEQAGYASEFVHEEWGEEETSTPICWGKTSLQDALHLITGERGVQLDLPRTS